MRQLKVTHMRYATAKSWFIRQHRPLLLGSDAAAKRQAWAACIAQLIQEDAVDPAQARRWMYPSELDHYHA